MRSQWIVGVVGMFGLMGCATTGGAVGALDARGVAMAQAQGVRDRFELLAVPLEVL